MQVSIAQVMAFAICGNARLAGFEAWRPDESLFQFVAQLDFAKVDQGRETPVADGPEAWFAWLDGEGVKGLRVIHQQRNGRGLGDRQSMAFAGGGPHWLIQTIGPKGVAHWEGHWTLGDRDAPDRRIWRVRYLQVDPGSAKLAPALDPVEAARRVKAALTEIRAFAEGKEFLGDFVGAFDRGLAALDGRIGRQARFPFAPQGFLQPEAERLLVANQAAWVFGGMGSWNDWSLKDRSEQARYEAVSEALFTALNDALAAAANSSFPKSVAFWPALDCPRRPWWRPW